MPSREVLYGVDTRAFREVIRPALLGNLGRLEPIIASRIADEIGPWLRSVIFATLRETKLHDKTGALYNQLLDGIRVYGAYNLNLTRGQIIAYPWIFAHEFGAKITPKGGRRYLAIPIFEGLRADGSPKFRDPKSWQRYGSFVYKSGDRLFLAYKSKTDGKLKVLYVLVEEVDIPARLGLRDVADQMYPALYAAWAQIFVEVATTYGLEPIWDVVL